MIQRMYSFLKIFGPMISIYRQTPKIAPNPTN